MEILYNGYMRIEIWGIHLSGIYYILTIKVNIFILYIHSYLKTLVLLKCIKWNVKKIYKEK